MGRPLILETTFLIDLERARWAAFIAPFYVLPSTADVSWHYGRTYRHLQADGRLIGARRQRV